MTPEKRDTEKQPGRMHEAEEKDRKERPERYPKGATGSPTRESEGKKS